MKLEFWDTEKDLYFVFAPVIYSLTKTRFSFGLELFCIRVFYFEYKR